jgi:hypothetical protein
MENDVDALHKALSLLREKHSGQPGDPRHVGQGELRRTLQAGMGLDELTADRVVKKLHETGRIVYADAGDVDSAAEVDRGGLLLLMPESKAPLAESQLLTTTLPGLLPNTPNNPAGGVTAGYPIGAKAADDAITQTGTLSDEEVRIRLEGEGRD